MRSGFSSQAGFSSHFLTSLNLEKVRISLNSRVSDDDPITLPSLITMSLKEIDFDDENDVEILLSGCPRLEHLELVLCDLGYANGIIEISSLSLKHLEILNCHALDFEVTCENLKCFMFLSGCTCDHHGGLTVWRCHNLRLVYVCSVGLKQLHLLGCQEGIESKIYTPSLVYMQFNGVSGAKVHFVQPMPSLLHATVEIRNDWWSFEYYSYLRDCLASFDCSEKVKICIHDAEGVIIPEHCRKKWSPPLPSIKQLQITFDNPLYDRDYWLDPSLTWIAPSAEILPHQYA